MKAMILAAGRGERMRPLTDTCPKPLLKVAGKPLIEHHIEKLMSIGITEIIINLAWLGKQIETYFGDGRKWGVNIAYSNEGDCALETAGGILKALPLLSGNEEQPYFLVVNGDIYTDFDYQGLPTDLDGKLAHLWLVENPEHNLNGDFVVVENMLANKEAYPNKETLTFSGISMYHRDFFNNIDLAKESAPSKKISLAPLIKAQADLKKVSAEKLDAFWTDVGTPERLIQLNNSVN